MPALRKSTRGERVAERAGRKVAWGGFALPKAPATAPDSKFRQWTRKRGCKVRQRSPKLHARCSPMVGTDYSKRPLIVFAHTPTGGQRAMSRKAPDVGHGIGLCSDLHDEQTRIGWPRFEKKYAINARVIAAELADEYRKKFGGQR